MCFYSFVLLRKFMLKVCQIIIEVSFEARYKSLLLLIKHKNYTELILYLKYNVIIKLSK